MKTIEQKGYGIDELSNEAKEKAIINIYNIDSDYYWSELIEEAREIGIDITSLDICKNHIDGELLVNLDEVAKNIQKTYIETTEMYKLASSYLEKYEKLDKKLNEVENHEEAESIKHEISELEEKFLQYILQQYLLIFREEFYHLIDEEAIIKIFKDNGYLFTKDGDLI